MKTIHKFGNIEALQRKQLNWRRIMSAVARSSPHYPKVEREKLADVEVKLRSLSGILGFWSVNRKALSNIGEALFQNSESGLKVICPVCIDGREKEIVGIPKVVSEHIALMSRVAEIVPIALITFLFATYGKTQPEEAKQKVREASNKTREHFSDPRYVAMEMDQYIPNIRAAEERIKSEIAGETEYFRVLSKRLAPERREYCVRRNLDQRFLQRAINKSMAEFLVLGRHAASTGTLICVHTTGRIRCFLKAGAAVLHNPVGVE